MSHNPEFVGAVVAVSLVGAFLALIVVVIVIAALLNNKNPYGIRVINNAVIDLYESGAITYHEDDGIVRRNKSIKPGSDIHKAVLNAAFQNGKIALPKDFHLNLAHGRRDIERLIPIKKETPEDLMRIPVHRIRESVSGTEFLPLIILGDGFKDYSVKNDSYAGDTSYASALSRDSGGE